LARTLAENQARLAQRIAAVLLHRCLAREDVLTAQNDGVRYLRVRLDREAAGKPGAAGGPLQDRLRALIEGVPVGLVMRIVRRRMPVMLRGCDDLRDSPERSPSCRSPHARRRCLAAGAAGTARGRSKDR
jgi:Cu/Ag efflux pump CusA